MSSSSISLAPPPAAATTEKTKTDTVCPVCWESVHSEKPVGITTGCGYVVRFGVCIECYTLWYWIWIGTCSLARMRASFSFSLSLLYIHIGIFGTNPVTKNGKKKENTFTNLRPPPRRQSQRPAYWDPTKARLLVYHQHNFHPWFDELALIIIILLPIIWIRIGIVWFAINPHKPLWKCLFDCRRLGPGTEIIPKMSWPN